MSDYSQITFATGVTEAPYWNKSIYRRFAWYFPLLIWFSFRTCGTDTRKGGTFSPRRHHGADSSRAGYDYDRRELVYCGSRSLYHGIAVYVNFAISSGWEVHSSTNPGVELGKCRLPGDLKVRKPHSISDIMEHSDGTTL